MSSVSYLTAKKLIFSHVAALETEVKTLDACLNYVVSENIRCTSSVPKQNIALKSGYALRYKELIAASPANPIEVPIIEELSAETRFSDAPCAAIKVDEGDFIPLISDSVLSSEDAEINGGKLQITFPLHKGQNVIRKGELIKKGKVAVKKNTFLTPPLIGFVAEMGIPEVSVYKKPKISVISSMGTKPSFSDYGNGPASRDPVSLMILSAISEMGVDVKYNQIAGFENDMDQIFEGALFSNDILVFIGDELTSADSQTRDLLSRMGIQCLFTRISQSPGNMFYAGAYGSKFVFGIPNDPAGAFVCFYEYVYPAIRQLMGFAFPDMQIFEGYLDQTVDNSERDHLLFLGCRLAQNGRGKIAYVVNKKSPYMPLNESSGFALIPPRRIMEKGDVVNVHHLPGGQMQHV